jgi:hypothetical protein
VDLNIKLQKYTGANGTANATGVFCLSGGVYFELNTRFEKYIAVNYPATVTYGGSPTYNTYTSNGYHVIVITAASAATINFNVGRTVNYIIVACGDGGRPGNRGNTGSTSTVVGGSGGSAGQVLTGSFFIQPGINYTITVGRVGGTTFNSVINNNLGTFVTAAGASGSGGGGGTTVSPAPSGIVGTTLPTTITVIINSITYTRLGGGGGAGGRSGGISGTGGLPGGGNGGNGGATVASGTGNTGFPGVAGTTNTGGGGGGGGAGGLVTGTGTGGVGGAGGTGGSGVIILYYR